MRAHKKITGTARTLLLIVIACSGVMQGALAATTVSGTITSNTTWSLAASPYQVTADISVDNGATLTVEAGVVVSFDSARNLTVTNGALVARGTAGQPIIFTSSVDTTGGIPAPGDWGQLRFLAATNDSTTIVEHAQVRYGQGISVTAASPTFNYLQLSNNSGAAISIDLNSSPRGIGNLATGNTLNAISVPPGDLLGTVTWGIKGIPYLVTAGVVSVGTTPAISSLSISEIQQGETINAIINGSRLSGAQSVGISNTGVTATVQSGATDTSVPIQMTASPGAALGAADITLQVAAGRPTQSGILQVIQPQPTVTGLSPNSLYAVQTGNVLTVNGRNFVAASVIQLDGADLTTSFISANSLSTTLPVLTPGNKSITVKQPDPLLAGSFLVSKPAALSVTAPALSITPASVSQLQGVPFDLTVAIPFAAPAGGSTVNLASNATGIATVPASVTILAGATSATVPVTTTGPGTASVTASTPGFDSATATLTVTQSPTLSLPATLALSMGSTTNVNFTLNVPAPGGGLTIILTSSNTAVATVPVSITLPAGATSGSFAVTAISLGTTTLSASAPGYAAGNTALTISAACAATPPGLVSWWPAEGNANDTIGANQGTLQNGTTFGTGEVGQAFSFDGINDYVQVPDKPNLNPNTNDFSVAFWIRTTSTGITRALINKRPVCNHASFWDLRIMGNGSLEVELDQSGAYYQAYTSTISVDDGHWHYVALVRKGVSSTLYIDAQIRGSGTSSGSANISSTAPILVGNDVCVNSDSTKPYAGFLDEIEYLNVALSQTQIQSTYSAGTTGMCK